MLAQEMSYIVAGVFPMRFVALVALVALATLATLVSFVSLVSLVSIVSLCCLVHQRGVFREMPPMLEMVS